MASIWCLFWLRHKNQIVAIFHRSWAINSKPIIAWKFSNTLTRLWNRGDLCQGPNYFTTYLLHLRLLSNQSWRLGCKFQFSIFERLYLHLTFVFQAAIKSLRNTEYDAYIVGLLVEMAHLDMVMKSGFNAAYSYFASINFSYGCTPHNWEFIHKKLQV